LLGGRALFAFQHGEVDSEGEPTERALLGAIMHSEFQAAMISWMRASDAFIGLWVKIQKALGRVR